MIITIPVYCWMLEYADVSASSPVPLCVRPVEPNPLMEAMVLSGEPVSPPRAMLVTGLNELPPEVWPANDPAHRHMLKLYHYHLHSNLFHKLALKSQQHKHKPIHTIVTLTDLAAYTCHKRDELISLKILILAKQFSLNVTKVV